jgi:hypothetical protein
VIVEDMVTIKDWDRTECIFGLADWCLWLLPRPLFPRLALELETRLRA